MRCISYSDYAYSNLSRPGNALLDRCKEIYLYKSKFKDYYSVIRKVKENIYPFIAKLNNGDTITITAKGEILSILYGLEYDKETDIIFLDNIDYPLKLYSAVDNGDIINIFYNNDYDFLSVEGKTVVDIGANIADSSLYFAFNNAKRVIALEPYPKNYEIAHHNIVLNHQEHNIDLHLAGCSGKDGEVVVDEEDYGVSRSLSMKSIVGRKVKLVSLDSMISTSKITTPAILKMDCEGCEYNAITESSDETLRRFSQIQIEYHYGYKCIKKRLQDAGFTVKNTMPKYSFDPNLSNNHVYMGWLFAWRKDSSI